MPDEEAERWRNKSAWPNKKAGEKMAQALAIALDNLNKARGFCDRDLCVDNLQYASGG